MGTGLYAAWRKYSRIAVDKMLHIKYSACLRNKHFSILCPNCIAGNIYHRLGMQFTTPTINCFTSQDEFIKVISNLQYYMAQDLQFISSTKGYPVAMLGDVVYNFNHDTDPRKCERDWYRRRERIQYDNLYIILYEEHPMNREEVEELANVPCKRLIVLTDRPDHTDLPYVKMLKRNYGRPNEKHFLDRDYFGVQTFEKQFDFVAWLNGSMKF